MNKLTTRCSLGMQQTQKKCLGTVLWINWLTEALSNNWTCSAWTHTGLTLRIWKYKTLFLQKSYSSLLNAFCHLLSKSNIEMYTDPNTAKWISWMISLKFGLWKACESIRKKDRDDIRKELLFSAWETEHTSNVHSQPWQPILSWAASKGLQLTGQGKGSNYPPLQCCIQLWGPSIRTWTCWGRSRPCHEDAQRAEAPLL